MASTLHFPKVSLQDVGYFDTAKGAFIPDESRKAVVDLETNKIFNIFTKNYRLVQHEDLLKDLDSVVNNFPEYGKPTKSVSLDREGGFMEAKYTFKDVLHKVKGTEGDGFHPVIHAFNSYDGWTKQKIFFGAFRLVCSNGMIVGEKMFSYNKLHLQNSDEPDYSELEQGFKTLSDQADMWKQWGKKKTKAVDYQDTLTAIKISKDQTLVLDAEYGRITGEEVQRTEEGNLKKAADTNKWDLFNVFTWYTTHCVKNLRSKVTLENRLRGHFYS